MNRELEKDIETWLEYLDLESMCEEEFEGDSYNMIGQLTDSALTELNIPLSDKYEALKIIKNYVNTALG